MASENALIGAAKDTNKWTPKEEPLTSAEIKQLEAFMILEGYPISKIDGKFSNNDELEGAVRDYAISVGLDLSGLNDQEALIAVHNEISGKLKYHIDNYEVDDTDAAWEAGPNYNEGFFREMGAEALEIIANNALELGERRVPKVETQAAQIFMNYVGARDQLNQSLDVDGLSVKNRTDGQGMKSAEGQQLQFGGFTYNTALRFDYTFNLNIMGNREDITAEYITVIAPSLIKYNEVSLARAAVRTYNANNQSSDNNTPSTDNQNNGDRNTGDRNTNDNQASIFDALAGRNNDLGGQNSRVQGRLEVIARDENKDPDDRKDAIETLVQLPELRRLVLRDLPEDDHQAYENYVRRVINGIIQDHPELKNFSDDKPVGTELDYDDSHTPPDNRQDLVIQLDDRGAVRETNEENFVALMENIENLDINDIPPPPEKELVEPPKYKKGPYMLTPTEVAEEQAAFKERAIEAQEKYLQEINAYLVGTLSPIIDAKRESNASQQDIDALIDLYRKSVDLFNDREMPRSLLMQDLSDREFAETFQNDTDHVVNRAVDPNQKPNYTIDLGLSPQGLDGQSSTERLGYKEYTNAFRLRDYETILKLRDATALNDEYGLMLLELINDIDEPRNINDLSEDKPVPKSDTVTMHDINAVYAYLRDIASAPKQGDIDPNNTMNMTAIEMLERLPEFVKAYENDLMANPVQESNPYSNLYWFKTYNEFADYANGELANFQHDASTTEPELNRSDEVGQNLTLDAQIYREEVEQNNDSLQKNNADSATLTSEQRDFFLPKAPSLYLSHEENYKREYQEPIENLKLLEPNLLAGTGLDYDGKAVSAKFNEQAQALENKYSTKYVFDRSEANAHAFGEIAKLFNNMKIYSVDHVNEIAFFADALVGYNIFVNLTDNFYDDVVGNPEKFGLQSGGELHTLLKEKKFNEVVSSKEFAEIIAYRSSTATFADEIDNDQTQLPNYELAYEQLTAAKELLDLDEYLKQGDVFQPKAYSSRAIIKLFREDYDSFYHKFDDADFTPEIGDLVILKGNKLGIVVADDPEGKLESANGNPSLVIASQIGIMEITDISLGDQENPDVEILENATVVDETRMIEKKDVKGFIDISEVISEQLFEKYDQRIQEKYNKADKALQYGEIRPIIPMGQ